MSSMESSFSTLDSQKWLELPRDVMLSIFMKFEAKEILETAQFVCKSWYNLCKDPSIWRNVMMQNLSGPGLAKKHEKMLCSAVDRSSGGLIKLDIEGFGGDELISYISQRCSQLKQLRLACLYSISANALSQALMKFPLLEVLDLTMHPFTEDRTLQIIRCCSSLISFKLNKQGSNSSNTSLACDDEALAIATSMPKLHVLQLIGNNMTDNGLKAILDNCPHIQSLDLRGCFHVTFDGNLWKRCCEQIKDMRPPYDFTDDYNYPVYPTINDVYDEYEEYCMCGGLTESSDEDRFDEAFYIDYYSL
ncbi:unnamed protein product [Amaranthus hypochondriacus]